MTAKEKLARATADEPEYVGDVRTIMREEILRLRADLAQAIQVLKQASKHVEELRDAWQRGAINECDGKGGTRSNRNADLDYQLYKVVAALEGRKIR